MLLKEIENEINRELENNTPDPFKNIYQLLATAYEDSETFTDDEEDTFDCWVDTFDRNDKLWGYYAAGEYYKELCENGIELIPLEEAKAGAIEINLIRKYTRHNYEESGALLKKVDAGEEDIDSLLKKFGVVFDADKEILTGKMGQCEWMIKDGIMTISPDRKREWNNELSNTGASYAFDWHDLDVTFYIKKVVITAPIVAGESMREFFCSLSDLEEIEGLENIDTRKVKNMNSMFSGCEKLTKLNLSSWDVSNVEDTGFMFFGCSNLKTIDLSFWNTKSLVRMNSMFGDCEKLEYLEISSFNTDNVVNMCGLFENCSSLSLLTFTDKIENWNVSNCKNVQCVFAGCENIAELDLSAWDLRSARDVAGMFYDCRSLTDLKLPRFPAGDVDYSGIFVNCPVGLQIIKKLTNDYFWLDRLSAKGVAVEDDY